MICNFGRSGPNNVPSPRDDFPGVCLLTISQETVGSFIPPEDRVLSTERRLESLKSFEGDLSVTGHGQLRFEKSRYIYLLIRACRENRTLLDNDPAPCCGVVCGIYLRYLKSRLKF